MFPLMFPLTSFYYLLHDPTYLAMNLKSALLSPDNKSFSVISPTLFNWFSSFPIPSDMAFRVSNLGVISLISFSILTCTFDHAVFGNNLIVIDLALGTLPDLWGGYTDYLDLTIVVLLLLFVFFVC